MRSRGSDVLPGGRRLPARLAPVLLFRLAAIGGAAAVWDTGTRTRCERRRLISEASAKAARPGLSRRRSRVRVPSLPSLKAPANKRFALTVQTRRPGSWPNPVAQTARKKIPSLTTGLPSDEATLGGSGGLKGRVAA